MNNRAIGDSWEDVERELFTPEEIAESRLRAAIIGELMPPILPANVPGIESALSIHKTGRREYA